MADLSNVELVVKLLSELNCKQIEAMNDNFIDVSADVYTYSNEHDILISKLKQ